MVAQPPASSSAPNTYRRLLVKLSGEALMGDAAYGIDVPTVERYAKDIRDVAATGTEVCLVVGGGNIFRGLSGAASGMDRGAADYMGMLATVINGMALQSTMEAMGLYTRLISAIEIQRVAEPYIRRRAIRHLEKGRVLIFSGGTGNPYFTTDSAAALRANEIDAEVILKGTRVDGIYSADPEKDPTATKYDHLSYDDAIERQLRIMDQTAFTMCRENGIPIIVFDINEPTNLRKIIFGETVGTTVS